MSTRPSTPRRTPGYHHEKHPISRNRPETRDREEWRLDGIIFRSSQTSGLGYNLVLFTHARRVIPRTMPPGTRVSIQMLSSGLGRDCLDNHGDIFVRERVPADPPPAKVSPIAKVGEHGFCGRFQRVAIEPYLTAELPVLMLLGELSRAWREFSSSRRVSHTSGERSRVLQLRGESPDATAPYPRRRVW